MLMTVSDDPFDENQKFAYKRVLILFKNDGTTLYLDSRSPTQHEITESTHINMTGKMEW